MLQIQTMSFITRNHLLKKKLFKSESPKELGKKNHQTMKSKGLLLMNNIIQELIIHLKSSQISQL